MNKITGNKHMKATCIAGRMKMENGFTLVELLVVVVLLVVVLSALYNLIFFVQESWSRYSAEARVIQEVREVMMGLEREIRQARVSAVDQDAVVSLSESSIIIYSDITKNGKPERIEYFLLEGALWRRVRMSSDETFPYQYDLNAEPENEEIVISWVRNTDLFVVEVIVENDPRRRVIITILADDDKKPLTQPLQINTTVFSRSRITG